MNVVASFPSANFIQLNKCELNYFKSQANALIEADNYYSLELLLDNAINILDHDEDFIVFLNNTLQLLMQKFVDFTKEFKDLAKLCTIIHTCYQVLKSLKSIRFKFNFDVYSYYSLLKDRLDYNLVTISRRHDYFYIYTESLLKTCYNFRNFTDKEISAFWFDKLLNLAQTAVTSCNLFGLHLKFYHATSSNEILFKNMNHEIWLQLLKNFINIDYTVCQLVFQILLEARKYESSTASNCNIVNNTFTEYYYQLLDNILMDSNTSNTPDLRICGNTIKKAEKVLAKYAVDCLESNEFLLLVQKFRTYVSPKNFNRTQTTDVVSSFYLYLTRFFVKKQIRVNKVCKTYCLGIMNNDIFLFTREMSSIVNSGLKLSSNIATENFNDILLHLGYLSPFSTLADVKKHFYSEAENYNSIENQIVSLKKINTLIKLISIYDPEFLQDIVCKIDTTINNSVFSATLFNILFKISLSVNLVFLQTSDILVDKQKLDLNKCFDLFKQKCGVDIITSPNDSDEFKKELEKCNDDFSATLSFLYSTFYSSNITFFTNLLDFRSQFQTQAQFLFKNITKSLLKDGTIIALNFFKKVFYQYTHYYVFSYFVNNNKRIKAQLYNDIADDLLSSDYFYSDQKNFLVQESILEGVTQAYPESSITSLKKLFNFFLTLKSKEIDESSLSRIKAYLKLSCKCLKAINAKTVFENIEFYLTFIKEIFLLFGSNAELAFLCFKCISSIVKSGTRYSLSTLDGLDRNNYSSVVDWDCSIYDLLNFLPYNSNSDKQADKSSILSVLHGYYEREHTGDYRNKIIQLKNLLAVHSNESIDDLIKYDLTAVAFYQLYLQLLSHYYNVDLARDIENIGTYFDELLRGCNEHLRGTFLKLNDAASELINCYKPLNYNDDEHLENTSTVYGLTFAMQNLNNLFVSLLCSKCKYNLFYKGAIPNKACNSCALVRSIYNKVSGKLIERLGPIKENLFSRKETSLIVLKQVLKFYKSRFLLSVNNRELYDIHTNLDELYILFRSYSPWLKESQIMFNKDYTFWKQLPCSFANDLVEMYFSVVTLNHTIKLDNQEVIFDPQYANAFVDYIRLYCICDAKTQIELSVIPQSSVLFSYASSFILDKTVVQERLLHLLSIEGNATPNADFIAETLNILVPTVLLILERLECSTRCESATLILAKTCLWIVNLNKDVIHKYYDIRVAMLIFFASMLQVTSKVDIGLLISLIQQCDCSDKLTVILGLISLNLTEENVEALPNLLSIDNLSLDLVNSALFSCIIVKYVNLLVKTQSSYKIPYSCLLLALKSLRMGLNQRFRNNILSTLFSRLTKNDIRWPNLKKGACSRAFSLRIAVSYELLQKYSIAAYDRPLIDIDSLKSMRVDPSITDKESTYNLVYYLFCLLKCNSNIKICNGQQQQIDSSLQSFIISLYDEVYYADNFFQDGLRYYSMTNHYSYNMIDSRTVLPITDIDIFLPKIDWRVSDLKCTWLRKKRLYLLTCLLDDIGFTNQELNCRMFDILKELPTALCNVIDLSNELLLFAKRMLQAPCSLIDKCSNNQKDCLYYKRLVSDYLLWCLNPVGTFKLLNYSISPFDFNAIHYNEKLHLIEMIGSACKQKTEIPYELWEKSVLLCFAFIVESVDVDDNLQSTKKRAVACLKKLGCRSENNVDAIYSLLSQLFNQASSNLFLVSTVLDFVSVLVQHIVTFTKSSAFMSKWLSRDDSILRLCLEVNKNSTKLLKDKQSLIYELITGNNDSKVMSHLTNHNNWLISVCVINTLTDSNYVPGYLHMLVMQLANNESSDSKLTMQALQHFLSVYEVILPFIFTSDEISQINSRIFMPDYIC